MDSLLILLIVLTSLGIPVCAITALVLVLKTRHNLVALNLRVGLLEAELGTAHALTRVLPTTRSNTAPEESLASAMPATPLAEEPRATVLVPAIQASAPEPTPKSQDFEEKLGARWAVWVGGAALALGGLFLVRYSIEQNLLDPKTRITLGGLFALALIAAGEWLRRHERSIALPGIPAANVPSILTAAGTCTAFASAYAAYALYDLIGPGTTFVLLGVIAALTMVAATLHDPTLAALGLLGAMGSPLLVSSEKPQPWALVIYLAFVVLPAYGVARLRLWRWLAVAGAVGALAWSLPIFVLDRSDALPAMAHLTLQLTLAAFFLVADPYRHMPNEEAGIDWLANAVLLAFALTSIIVSGSVMAGDGRPVFIGLVAIILLATGTRFAPAAPAAAAAAVTTVGTLLLWPIARELGSDPENFFYQSGDAFALRPHALGTYLSVACLLPALIAIASLLRLTLSWNLALSTTAWYAGAATAGPLLALVASYWRVAAFERSVSFALVAGALGLVFVSATAWLNRQSSSDSPNIRLGIGATASAALAALALGLTFSLDKGMLTVAFALAAFGTAWIADRISIPALRYAVGAIGLIVLGRLIWSPTIVGGDPGPLIVNWLLWGYGVPAVSFFYAARLLQKTGRDRVVQFTESLSIVFAAFLIFFEIRHALHQGNMLEDSIDHLEVGLLATESLAFAILLARLDIRMTDPVYRWGALIFKLASLALCGVGLLLVTNPLLTGDKVLGGELFNSLIPAYLLPSLLAFLLALIKRGSRPSFYSWSSAILGLLLQMAYVGLEIRRVFQGPALGFWRGITQGEQWSYSVALLVAGIGLLGIGLLRDIRFARLASAVYLVLAVLKVFIVDLANLEGVMRALSFIGLGLVLIGIGLVYQRLLAQRPGNAVVSQ